MKRHQYICLVTVEKLAQTKADYRHLCYSDYNLRNVHPFAFVVHEPVEVRRHPEQPGHDEDIE